jgi:hypothetical protein
MAAADTATWKAPTQSVGLNIPNNPYMLCEASSKLPLSRAHVNKKQARFKRNLTCNLRHRPHNQSMSAMAVKYRFCRIVTS